MEYQERKNAPVYYKRVRAGRKRTYFIDVRQTRNGDYYLTITESKRQLPRFEDERERFIKHKIFLYKEDFMKFAHALNDAIEYVKQQMPDFDFDRFSHSQEESRPMDEMEMADEAFEADDLPSLDDELDNFDDAAKQTEVPPAQ